MSSDLTTTTSNSPKNFQNCIPARDEVLKKGRDYLDLSNGVTQFEDLPQLNTKAIDFLKFSCPLIIKEVHEEGKTDQKDIELFMKLMKDPIRNLDDKNSFHQFITDSLQKLDPNYFSNKYNWK